MGLAREPSARVFKAANADSPGCTVYHAPGAAGLQLLVERAREFGKFPSHVLVELEAAAEAIAQLTTEIEGGRTALQSMIAGWEPSLLNRVLAEACQSMFRGRRVVSGVSSRITLATTIIGGRPEEENLRAAVLQGAVELEFHRPTSFMRMAVHRGKSGGGTGGGMLPLDLERFCSRPPADFAQEPAPGNDTLSWMVLDGDTAGLGERIDMFVGGYGTRVRKDWLDLDKPRKAIVDVKIPTKLLCFDFIASPDLLGPDGPSVSAHDGVFAKHAMEFSELTRIDLSCELEQLSITPFLMELEGLPRYQEMLLGVLSELGPGSGVPERLPPQGRLSSVRSGLRDSHPLRDSRRRTREVRLAPAEDERRGVHGKQGGERA